MILQNCIIIMYIFRIRMRHVPHCALDRYAYGLQGSSRQTRNHPGRTLPAAARMAGPAAAVPAAIMLAGTAPLQSMVWCRAVCGMQFCSRDRQKHHASGSIRLLATSLMLPWSSAGLDSTRQQRPACCGRRTRGGVAAALLLANAAVAGECSCHRAARWGIRDHDGWN
jgi:hypothetical protein